MDFSGRHVALWWGLMVCWGLAAVLWVWFFTVGCFFFFFFFFGDVDGLGFFFLFFFWGVDGRL